jgi:hypothetical protein
MIARWKDLSKAYNSQEKLALLDKNIQEQHTQKNIV